MNRYWADVSNWNGNVDWNAYAKQGQHVLVGLKASEGEGFVDKTHATRSENAHKAGVWCLHYHFGHPKGSAKEQAQFFWKQIQGHFAPKDFACIDIETTDGLGWGVTASWLNAFDAYFREISGHTLIGYANESDLSEIIPRGGNVAGGRWWIAAYGGPGNAPRGAKRWGHQFTNGKEGPQPHACAGIGPCDVSDLNWATYLRLRMSRPRI